MGHLAQSMLGIDQIPQTAGATWIAKFTGASPGREMVPHPLYRPNMAGLPQFSGHGVLIFPETVA